MSKMCEIPFQYRSLSVTNDIYLPFSRFNLTCQFLNNTTTVVWDIYTASCSLRITLKKESDRLIKEPKSSVIMGSK